MKPAVFNQNFQIRQPFPLPHPHEQQLSKFFAFHKYLEAYTTAFHFNYEIKLIKKRQYQLLSRIKNIETHLDKHEPQPRESSSSQKPKRKRRLAQQIERNFVCNEQKCQKNYGTLGSLQQHIRLKHPQKFKEQIQSESYYPFMVDRQVKKQEQPSGQKQQ